MSRSPKNCGSFGDPQVDLASFRQPLTRSAMLATISVRFGLGEPPAVWSTRPGAGKRSSGAATPLAARCVDRV
jgi:hypothetical protein